METAHTYSSSAFLVLTLLSRELICDNLLSFCHFLPLFRERRKTQWKLLSLFSPVECDGSKVHAVVISLCVCCAKIIPPHTYSLFLSASLLKLTSHLFH